MVGDEDKSFGVRGFVDADVSVWICQRSLQSFLLSTFSFSTKPLYEATERRSYYTILSIFVYGALESHRRFAGAEGFNVDIRVALLASVLRLSTASMM